MHDDVHAPASPAPSGTARSASAGPADARSADAAPRPFADRVGRWLPTPASRLFFAAFLVVVLVHLVAQVALADGPRLAAWTQWLMAPLLAATLWCTTTQRPRLLVLTAVGLLWSWAGDVVPFFVPDSVSFLVLMALFLGAQVSYSLAFWPYREQSVVRRRRPAVAPYVAVYVVIAGGASAALLPTGADAVPLVVGLVVYGAALVLMALLSTGVDRLAGLGGILFLVSDGLLGVRQALPDLDDALPAGVYGALVMATYAAAQALLAAGVRRETSL